jgi:hypothetical protein
MAKAVKTGEKYSKFSQVSRENTVKLRSELKWWKQWCQGERIR